MNRTGIGYDIHRLVEGRRLVLCGVEIPCEKGLLGHSDADVATHALIDALLGAAAVGDIGKMFPDTQAKWKDADSIKLLEMASASIAASGWKPGNADITIICERPKLAQHIDAMRGRLAAALGIGVGAVSVKATTNEGLGAMGRGEGIAAMAVATLVRSRQSRNAATKPANQGKGSSK